MIASTLLESSFMCISRRWKEAMSSASASLVMIVRNGDRSSRAPAWAGAMSTSSASSAARVNAARGALPRGADKGITTLFPFKH